MVKFFLGLFLLFYSGQTLSITKTQFLPLDQNVVINITETDISGPSDTDASDLYALMKVEEKQSSMGIGKTIKTSQKDFNMVCLKEKKTCHIILNKSVNTVISSGQKFAQYRATKELADNLIQRFHLNDQNVLLFIASDQKFTLKAEPGLFHFEVR